VHFARAVTGGTLTARGRLVHRSLGLRMAQAELFDDRGKTMDRDAGTFLPKGPPLSPEIGYV
jgi:acyl-coenzyme A thioesterase PaaI-like protein